MYLFSQANRAAGAIDSHVPPTQHQHPVAQLLERYAAAQGGTEVLEEFSLLRFTVTFSTFEDGEEKPGETVFAVELQRTGRQGEEDYLNAALSLANKLSVPVVASRSVSSLGTTS